jgi:hypothetical protein
MAATKGTGQEMKQLLAAVTLGIAAVGYAAAPALGAKEGDRQIAKAGVFQADDFPAGWEKRPSKKGVTTDPFALECPALKKSAGARSPSAILSTPSDAGDGQWVGLRLQRERRETRSLRAWSPAFPVASSEGCKWAELLPLGATGIYPTPLIRYQSVTTKQEEPRAWR